MMSLSDDEQTDIIDTFNTTSRYLYILNINNVYFDNMVSQIYPSELQLNKANTEAAFLDLHLSIIKEIVSTKIYDKRDDFDFEIVKVSKGAKIWNRYKQVPHLTQDNNSNKLTARHHKREPRGQRFPSR